MESWWKEAEAREIIAAEATRGIGEDLALRIYTSRLLGRQPKLVLHGGGNTSVKTKARDIVGDESEVLHIKGSGHDMADIGAYGLPAVRLEPLLALRKLDKLSDEDMVDMLRSNLLNSRAPNPSVETLLHAFLPHKYIDHTHSTSVLALVDQEKSAALVEEVYGKRVAPVPYIIPGFALAKLAADVFEKNPKVEGLILDKHGIFSFGETAREAYERMIAFVTLAEQRLTLTRIAGRATQSDLSLKGEVNGNPLPSGRGQGEGVAKIAPALRGAFASDLGQGNFRRWVLEFRTNDRILEFARGAELNRYANAGVATPDHVIRVKPKPLIVSAETAANPSTLRAAVKAYEDDYNAYFERNNTRAGGIKKKLDTTPRIVIVPGLGLFGVGKSAKDAKIAADVYEIGIETIQDAEALGQFKSISEADLFDMEYWSLEQAKLGSAAEAPLARHIAVITGGAGTIGLATAKAFAKAGAEVALLDLDPERTELAVRAVGGNAFGVPCDVTSAEDIARAFADVAERFGGIDILVSNAGTVTQGPIAELSDEALRASFEINFFAHQAAAQAAVKIMKAQGTGGCLLFNVSKQAINPGPDFGAYGLPKAATLFLSRQYALEHGKDGIRSNAVNADRIRSGILTGEMIASRSAKRGLSEADYMGGNLLGQEVRAEDVAKAFVDLALSPRTTGCVITVDGGNIAAALR